MLGPGPLTCPSSPGSMYLLHADRSYFNFPGFHASGQISSGNLPFHRAAKGCTSYLVSNFVLPSTLKAILPVMTASPPLLFKPRIFQVAGLSLVPTSNSWADLEVLNPSTVFRVPDGIKPPIFCLNYSKLVFLLSSVSCRAAGIITLKHQ